MVMEGLGSRKSELVNMVHKRDGLVVLEFHIPTGVCLAIAPSS